MRIAYGIPCYRQNVNIGHVAQGIAMRQVADHFGAPLMLTWADSCSLAWSRNHMLWWSIKQGVTWLLTSDADTYHMKPGDIAGMLAEGVKRDAAVIAAPVRMRNRGGFNLAKVDAEGEEHPYAEDEFKGKTLEVDQIGTGFMAINCEWVKRCMPEPWFEMHQVPSTDLSPPGWNGEDYHFCRGVKARGGLILADGRFEPTHMGASSEVAAFLDLGALVVERAA
jgi:hypothetical protein